MRRPPLIGRRDEDAELTRVLGDAYRTDQVKTARLIPGFGEQPDQSTAALPTRSSATGAELRSLAAAARQTEQRHVRDRVPRAATVRRERAPVAIRLLLVVRVSSEPLGVPPRLRCSLRRGGGASLSRQAPKVRGRARVGRAALLEVGVMYSFFGPIDEVAG
jgi:hypothetical protein